MILALATALTLPLCEIVVATDRASAAEIRAHEEAHCNGWVHEDQGHGAQGPRRGYQAPKPPAEYAHPYPGPLLVHEAPTARAKELCRRLIGVASYGCAKGGL